MKTLVLLLGLAAFSLSTAPAFAGGCMGSQPPLPNFRDASMRRHATVVTCTLILRGLKKGFQSALTSIYRLRVTTTNIKLMKQVPRGVPRP